MTFQVRFTQTAKVEIDTAYSWLKAQNSLYADNWFRDLMDTVATLQEMPLRCGLAPENDTFTEEIHQLIYGKSKRSTEFCLLFEKILFSFFMYVIVRKLH